MAIFLTILIRNVTLTFVWANDNILEETRCVCGYNVDINLISDLFLMPMKVSTIQSKLETGGNNFGTTQMINPKHILQSYSVEDETKDYFNNMFNGLPRREKVEGKKIYEQKEEQRDIYDERENQHKMLHATKEDLFKLMTATPGIRLKHMKLYDKDGRQTTDKKKFLDDCANLCGHTKEIKQRIVGINKKSVRVTQGHKTKDGKAVDTYE